MNNLNTLEKFQSDLKEGMTLSEACCKHEVTLDYAFRNMGKMETMVKAKAKAKAKTLNPAPRIRRSKKKRNLKALNPSRYIFQRGEVFSVRKSVKCRTKIFGSYNSLEDACRVRDELERIGWKQRQVDNVCERLGVERRKGYKNSSVRYS